MTGAAGKLVLVVLGLLLVLTYLLLRSGASDAALHERRLRTVDALILNQAALQRDVLRVSHGLLLNYDPLVAAVTRLRTVGADLRAAGAASDPLIDRIAAELEVQEELVESFKSLHALLRNSLIYFAHASGGFGAADGSSAPAASVVGKLASDMLQFVTSANGEPERAELAALLDRLSTVPASPDLRSDLAALQAHGRLILSKLPAANGALASLLTTRIADQARELQDLFIEQQRREESRAWIFRAPLPRVGAAADLSESALCPAAPERAHAQVSIGVRAVDRRHLGATDRPADRTYRTGGAAGPRAAGPPYRRRSRLHGAAPRRCGRSGAAGLVSRRVRRARRLARRRRAGALLDLASGSSWAAWLHRRARRRLAAG
jgi:hypothetical protein